MDDPEVLRPSFGLHVSEIASKASIGADLLCEVIPTVRYGQKEAARVHF